jgi:cytochrome c biogenesis protein
MRSPLSTEEEKGLLSTFWDSLSSVRLTIPLLIVLAVVSIFGTLIPQNATPEEYLRIYKISTYKILRILGFLDMYHAGWFVFLLALLSLNLMVCSLRRWPSVRRFFSQPQIKLEEGQWKGIAPGRRFLLSRSAEDSLGGIQRSLSRTFGEPRVLQEEGRWYLFAEKGRLSRLGFYCIHLSILVILLGAMIGSFFGFRGYVNITEGETVDRVFLRSGQQVEPLGFKVKLDQFSVSFYPTGAPQEFKSTVTILEGSRRVLTEPIRVNEPLTYKGISLYQSSYGVASVKKALLDVVERSSRRGFTLSLQLGVRAEIPGTPNSLVLDRFIPDLRGMGPAFQGTLLEGDRPVENLVILQSHPEFVPQKPGRYEFRVREIQPKYYSGLQVNKDPGVWVVWGGCFLMMVGFYMTFFMSHRRVWVRMMERKGETQVEMAGSSHRNRSEFDKEMDRIGKAVKEAISSEKMESAAGGPS